MANLKDSSFQNEARDALYKAAKEAAIVVENALTSENFDNGANNQQRLEVALKLLEIAWKPKS